MNTTLKDLKNFVKTASNENLIAAYIELNKKLKTADFIETFAFTAVTCEMKDRNLLAFDKVSLKFVLIG